MRFSTLLTAAMATAVSATRAADSNSQSIGVTFFEHVNWAGFNYDVPSLNRCWRLPETLFQKVSSVRFNTNSVSCALFRGPVCIPPALYTGLRESVRDLHEFGVGDATGSVRCIAI